jgi:hypothetical protein
VPSQAEQIIFEMQSQGISQKKSSKKKSFFKLQKTIFKIFFPL